MIGVLANNGNVNSRGLENGRHWPSSTADLVKQLDNAKEVKASVSTVMDLDHHDSSDYRLGCLLITAVHLKEPM